MQIGFELQRFATRGELLPRDLAQVFKILRRHESWQYHIAVLAQRIEFEGYRGLHYNPAVDDMGEILHREAIESAQRDRSTQTEPCHTLSASLSTSLQR